MSILRSLLRKRRQKLERPDQGGQVYKPLDPLEERLAAWRRVIPDERQRAIYDRAAETVDRAAYAELQRKYAPLIDPDDQGAVSKYLDLAPWFKIHSRLAMLLDLDRRPLCSILDIGSGGGQFLAIAKAYGHEVRGLDLPRPELYGDLLRLFEIERVEGGVRLGEPLPPQIGRFGLIVINGQIFDRFEGTTQRWKLPEWAGLIRYLTANHLDYPGELFIGLNRSDGPVGNEEFYWPLVDLAEVHGASVDRKKATMHFRLDAPLAFPEVESITWKAARPANS